MFRSLLIGLGAGFLGLAGAAITPVIVGLLGAFGGATAIVGLAAFRAFRRRGRPSVSRPGDAETARNIGHFFRHPPPTADRE